MKRRLKVFCTVMLAGTVGLQVHAAQTVTSAQTETAKEQEVQKPKMTLEEYPRIDGSLACVPLCEALAVEMTGCSKAEAEETMAAFTNTNPCYLELAEGRKDILLAYEPAQSTKEELKNYDPLDMEPVGKDALVFLVNEDNPVESLTKEQVYDIYTGKITNWSEVGGEDIEIKAFQRPETSGSQTMMRKLLIGDAAMAEAPKEMIASGMDDIIEALTQYDNSANALGYSVYYYASSMFQQPGLKFLQVDGVEPSSETIQSGEYPLINEFYCVTNEQSSERAKEIKAWLLTEEGQEFVKECGYVPVG
ncbi:MAG: substrate-binding domain-containing protein [Lachnospiraceae bacterium]|nr:substrate-binding domain-containing protein [Robinsoniella sp.]MDY3766901.1 substrate-binding domain-containing protein [Lachnospiraceae bacterium]